VRPAAAVRERTWTLRRRIGQICAVIAGALALLVAAVVVIGVEFGGTSDAGVAIGTTVGLTGLVLIGLGYGVWHGLHRWVLAPIDRLGSQTRTVAQGETYRQIVPDGPLELTRLGRDVEAMRLQIAGQLARAEQAHQELQLRSEELARSNDDLQQFAYVASHDLSEPLRKVANFCQLLERQYGAQLDDRARQYIDFAVDGAKRMQVLISDLLELSRVGRTTEEFVPVALDEALDGALHNLADKIEETGTRVERLTALPTVAGDKSLLISLLENLVGNAVKYRRDGVAPVVQIAAEREPDMWQVTVRDNGIGIDPQYAERIFAVFQRLHLRDKYGGTGIGLALCRKIVEFHGGHIWLDTVESPPGAAFTFTVPEGGVLAESRD
jgi:light-regulated signal transduction histidine kinase (bacteriophytochrome)